MASTIGAPGDTARARALVEDEHRGRGWVRFAAVVIGLYGLVNIGYGIEAIGDARVYVDDVQLVIGELAMWGWFLLGVAVVQIGAAVGIWRGSQTGRWIGIACAGVNAIIQLVILPAYPLWVLSIFTLDLLVLYGLIVHGGRRTPA